MRFLNKTSISFILTFLIILIGSFIVLYLSGASEEGVSPDDAIANDCVGENC